METNGQMAVVGDRDSILAFRTLGMKTMAADTPKEAELLVNRLSREGYHVIFITEKAAAMIPEVLAKYKTAAYPAVIPIPDRFGSNGAGMRGIQENMKKAVGFDIFENGKGGKNG